MKRLARIVAAAALCVLDPLSAHAQAGGNGRPGDTRLIVTVVDQTNAVLPTATVTVAGIEDATRQKTIAPVQTTLQGVATIPGLTPGRYSITAEFPGFDTNSLKDVRARPGDNRQTIVLTIQRVEQSVTVQQDKQEGAADRRSDAFGTTLTRETVDALSDDPNEMQQQLQDMVGPGAVIRIDSFEGGTLPPKAQIKSIHITRDQFAAENHSSDGTFIDIITQPGIGPLRTQMNYQGHSSGMAAPNAFAPTKGSDQAQNYGFFMNGGIVQNKASFFVGVRGNLQYDVPVVNAALPDGTLTQTTQLKAPRNNRFINSNLDYAVTPDQTLRFTYNQTDFNNGNLGVGGFNLPEHAYSTANHTHQLRVQEVGPLGRRAFMNTRITLGTTDTASRAAIEAPTIVVLDSFTTGGAQMAGGRHSKDFEAASDIDYVRGKHSVRGGTLIDANWFHSNDTSNYLGTYTFENLAAYNAGLPTSYTRRIGDPNISFTNAQAAFYLQDDIRVIKSLTVTTGVRYEAQTHMHDANNIGPRLGTTWAPFKNGKATLRASWGLFYDWLATTTYEQTLRVDGIHQQELNILDPSYPNVDESTATAVPTDRYLLGTNIQNPRSSRISAGVDYAFMPSLRLSATYRYLRGSDVLRGLNLNAPVDGVRPNPLVGNVIEVVPDAASRQHSVQLNLQTPPPPQFSGGGPLWNWKRVALFGLYTWTRSENNSDGAFSTPADGNLVDEWGAATGIVTHRFQGGFIDAQLRNFTWNIFTQVTSGLPYTILTGTDDNGDLIFNDRPAGVARNTLRAAPQMTLDLYAAYSFTFGPRITLPGVPVVYGTPAGLNVATYAPPTQGRFKITFILYAQNVTNHENLTGYSGVMTSPFFGRPTNALNPRRINVGLGFAF